MKKLITIILIISLLLPAASLAESNYSPHLQMTIQEYIIKYNSIQAALDSPYVSIDNPYSWSDWEGFHIAWFYADKDHKTSILLMTKDPSYGKKLTAGLDQIQIYSNDQEFVSLISVATRCSQIFSADILGTSLASKRVADVICYYFENNCKAKNLIAYQGLDENNECVLSFYYSGNYTFNILLLEDMQ